MGAGSPTLEHARPLVAAALARAADHGARHAVVRFADVRTLAVYAGTSFVAPEDVGRLQYGSS